MKKKHLKLVALSALFSCGAAFTTADALELAPSSFGRVLDRPTLGSLAGGSDDINNNAGYLWVGDRSNNNDIYQSGFMFSLAQDWSFVDENTTFTLSFEIAEIAGEGWSSINLMHVPTYGLETVERSIILGGDFVSSYDTSGVVVGDTIVFDVTSLVKDDIANERAFSVFRLQQSVLFNNENGANDYLRFNAEGVSLTSIPEPSTVTMGIAGAAALFVMLRRKK